MSCSSSEGNSDSNPGTMNDARGLTQRSLHILPPMAGGGGSGSLHLIPNGSVEEVSPVPNIDALHALPTGAPTYAKIINH
eukprot:snap_masked-scaffold732_size105256-processed-gene-0.6 protein:Tk09375 transcript:snap_masked-scaffold732_size105256-processed-gene-0.6-mRNA-1 annotation:"hypothetical protein"